MDRMGRHVYIFRAAKQLFIGLSHSLDVQIITYFRTKVGLKQVWRIHSGFITIRTLQRNICT